MPRSRLPSFVALVIAVVAFASPRVARAQHPSRAGPATGATVTNGVLYAPIPHTSSLTNDFNALRCYAAIADRASRALVLMDAPSDGPRVVDYVVPALARAWRLVNADDDANVARARKGDLSWCLDLSRHGAQLTSRTGTEALSRRFSSARRACVVDASSASNCGALDDDVRMVLKQSVGNNLDALPNELMELLRRGDITESVVVSAVASAGDDANEAASSEMREESASAASSEMREESASAAASEMREEIVLTMENHPIVTTEVAAAGLDETPRVLSFARSGGIPETKLKPLATSRPRRPGGVLDSSRALITLGISVGLVGIFMNVFAHARHASKRDELASLMIGRASEYEASRASKSDVASV